MTRSLSPDELIALLDGWAGGGVAVRIVSPPGELVAIFEGRLGTRSGAKDPSAFWALEAASTPTGAEQPGLYLHPGLIDDACLHTGDSVVEWRQAETVVNVRRL